MENFPEYTVSIIDNPAHLTEALELRYKVYSKTYPELIRNVSANSESDCFDPRRIHIGLYAESASGKKLAGYCRLILPEFFSACLEDYLLREHPLYNFPNPYTKERMAVSARLLKTGYYEKVESLCKNFEQDGIIYIETSRLILDENYRGLSLMMFFFKKLFTISNALNIRQTFFTCRPHHIAFYQNYGFTPFPGTCAFDNEIFGIHHLLFGNVQEIASGLECTARKENKKAFEFKSAA
jgi:hypothetical protein